MSKIIKTISNIVLVIVIIILSSYLILKFTNKMTIYKVLTNSMETGIHAGDYIVITKSKEYKKGDVITYINEDGYFITHRIIKIKDNKVITKGDANNTEDEAIDITDIKGKLVYKGKILNFIMNFRYIIVALIIGLFLVSGYLDKQEKKKVLEV